MVGPKLMGWTYVVGLGQIWWASRYEVEPNLMSLT